MNRTIVKTGAALAIVAGLMGGVPAVPAAYADAPAAEAQQVTKEQLQKLVDEVTALRANIDPESWVASDVDAVLTNAFLAMQKNQSDSYNNWFNRIEQAVGNLKPGKNLTLFVDPSTNEIKGANADNDGLGNSDLLRAFWFTPGVNSDNPGHSRLPLKQAVDGLARWELDPTALRGTALVGVDSTKDDKSKKMPVYIQFDLEKSESIAAFRLWRRPIDGASYVNTALVVSDHADFSTKTVVYYSGDNNVAKDVFGFGQDYTDAYYTETAEGKNLLEGKRPVTGRYVRLYMNGTTKDVGGRNAVLEVAMSGADKVDSSQLYDTAELEATIVRVRALLRDHAGDYSAETVKTLEESLAKAEDLLARIKAGTATENLGAVSDLNAAIAQAEQNLVKAYTVTFDDKIDATENVAIEAAEGTAIALPANPVHPQGYAFEGWFLDKEGKTAFDPAAHTAGDITVYAKWSTPAAELKPAEPVKPEAKPENGKKPAKGGKLPQTGDASVFAVAASALGSAAAFAAARRRK